MTRVSLLVMFVAAACGSKAPPAPAEPTETTTPTPATEPVDAGVVDAPSGPQSYAAEVTASREGYAPTATAATDDVVHAGAAAVVHVDVRFPTTGPGTLTQGYTGFAVGHPGPVTFTAPEGIVIEPAKIKLRDPAVTATNEHVAFDVHVTAAAAGAVPISADIKYALCDKERCDVTTATLRWTIQVVP